MAEAGQKDGDSNTVELEVNANQGKSDSDQAVHRSLSMEAFQSLKDAVQQKTRKRKLSKTEAEMQNWSPWRMKVHDMMYSTAFDLLMGLIIIFNVGIMLADADARARAFPTPYQNGTFEALNRILLGVYFAELCARAFVDRDKFFFSGWNCLDFAIVFFAAVDEILGPALQDIAAVEILPLLRVLRISRLFRAMRLLRVFPELYIMVRGFLGAMKAMFWGALLIIVLLGVWALVCTEIVHPVNYRMIQRLREEDPDLVDKDCEIAFSTIFNAALFTFQTLVAGDSWGACTIPLIRERPSFFIIFALALVSVSLGFMNLVLAVIVDNASASRESDKEEKMNDKKREEAEALQKWKEVIKTIDDDDSGTISHEELMSGYDVPEVREVLEVMGIDRSDLEAMFKLMDDEGSGELKYDEFIDTFVKAQAQDMRVYLMMTKLELDSVARAARRMNEDLITTMQEAKAVHTEMTHQVMQASSTSGNAKNLNMSQSVKNTVSKSPQLPDTVTTARFEADFQKLSLQIQEQFQALAASIEINTNTLNQHAAAVLAAPMQPVGGPNIPKATLARGTPSQLRGQREVQTHQLGLASAGDATSENDALFMQDALITSSV